MSAINVKPLGNPTTELLGAGAIYIGGDLETASGASFTGVLLGATKGGSSFSDNAEFRRREADADYFPIEGATDLVKMTPQLTVNSLTITAADLEKAFAGMDTTAGTNYDSVTRSFTMTYTDRLYWIGKTRAGKDIAIELDNVLPDAPLSMSFGKDEEVVLNTVFTAHADPSTFDIDDITTYPYHIVFEKSA